MVTPEIKTRLLAEVDKLHAFHRQAGEALMTEVLKILDAGGDHGNSQITMVNRLQDLETKVAALAARLEQIHKLSDTNV